MKRVAAVALVVVGLFGSIAGTLRAEVTAEQVRKAIDHGVNFLKGQQRADGSWNETILVQNGGVSALATLALLNAGVDPSDECIQKALANLRNLKPKRTYVVSLQTMVFARAEPEKDRVLIRRNVNWLEATQNVGEGHYKGAWTYMGNSSDDDALDPVSLGVLHGDGDNSNSQFALLGLHEAERVGISAREQTWRLAKAYWERCQNPDGSWGYKQDAAGTGSMTCAGITSMVIASDRVQAGDARVDGDHIECCVSNKSDDADRIQRALQWLGHPDHFSVDRNPGDRSWLLYYLYGLERAGRLTAHRFLPSSARAGQPDRIDWYREGADHLVRNQESMSGFWPGVGISENDHTIGTSLALLFLSKGRWPVLLGKLQSSSGNDWNQHRSDVGNLTLYVERQWKRDLTWQIIDLRLASVEELRQTPVVYLCGSQSPLPDDPAERKILAQKLRDYLDRDGFLFAEAYCGEGAGFDKGFRELMQLVFPEPEYKLRLLELEHPIWYAEEKIDPKQVRPIYGIDFGCRTSVVYAPQDPVRSPRPSLSCLWELSRPGRGEKYSRAVQAQIDAALSLGINVLAYATNRELKEKDPSALSTTPRKPGDRMERGRFNVATLRHPGGCNVAPRALVNLMESATRELKIRARVREELLDITDEALFDQQLVFMHGRTAFHLTPAEGRQLRQYVERGGTLFADSICANKAFTESFRREMAAIFPKSKWERIPVSDPLLGTTYGGFDLKSVSRRDPESGGAGKPIKDVTRKVPPDLEGIKIGDRWGVVFSQFDLSCALEKHDSLGCRGYTREDAARIGLNVVLYSLKH